MTIHRASPGTAEGTAAAGHAAFDAQRSSAGGGTISDPDHSPSPGPLAGSKAAAGQLKCDAQTLAAGGGAIDHASRRYHAAVLAAALAGEGDPALIPAVKKRRQLADLIGRHGRRRRYAMRVQQMLDRSLESFVRRNFTAWSPEAPERERAAHNAETARLIKAGRQGEGAADLVILVQASDDSRAAYDAIRKAAEKEMTALARQLPAAAWIESVHGAGLLGLASIIAETGTLDGYGNPAKLWSRLGFAPFEGFALSSYLRPSWRPRALSNEEWVQHPFAAQRYASMIMIATSLRNAQWMSAKATGESEGRPKGPYGMAYAERRAHCDLTHPDWTPAHRERDALRVMMKCFLRDLWVAWMDLSFAPGQWQSDAQKLVVESENAAAGHGFVDAQRVTAGGGPSPRSPSLDPGGAGMPAAGQSSTDAHASAAGGGSLPPAKARARRQPQPRPAAP